MRQKEREFLHVDYSAIASFILPSGSVSTLSIKTRKIFHTNRQFLEQAEPKGTNNILFSISPSLKWKL